MDKLIRNSTVDFLIFSSQSGSLEEISVVKKPFTSKILVVSKMEITCKNSLQVQKRNHNE